MTTTVAALTAPTHRPGPWALHAMQRAWSKAHLTGRTLIG